MIGLNRRRVMGKSLPYDAEIEYLETDGNAYIDTGLTVSYYRAIAGKYYVPNANNMIWGSRVRDNNYFGYHLRKGVKADTYLKVNDKEYTFKDSKNIEMHEFLFDIGNAYVVFDGVRTDFPAPSQLPIQESNNKEILFKFWGGGAVNGYDTKRIYYAKYLEAGVLMRDFIPVRIGSTGYMYDKVSGQLFGNAGTGEFILGPDVNSDNS